MKEIVHNLIYEPWPWYIGGPLIGLFVIALILLEKKQLGISSSNQFICAKISPIKLDYFNKPEKNRWQFFFVIGLVLGGIIIHQLVPTYEIAITEGAQSKLSEIGVQSQAGFVPKELYNFQPASIAYLLIGGIFLGFGARYANGCTAGHAIMGISQLAPSSIISTVCFFIGGLLSTYFIIPLLL